MITGFLGPNGAGKSTTMRMMVGLTTPSAGRSTILGLDYRRLPNPGRHVGVLLDASAQHAGRTGREVLTLAATVMGVPGTRVDDLVVIGRGAIVARGAKNDLLASGSTLVRSVDDRALSPALAGAGIVHTAAPEGGYLTSASADRVAAAAMAAGVILVELRPAAETGLEDMFLRLTADHAREDATEGTRR